MKLTLILLFAFFPLAASPQQMDTQPANVTKVVRIKYGIAQKIADLVAPGIPVRFNADNYSNVIVLKGTPKDVASAEQTIRELDVPGARPTSYKSKDVELIVSVIAGSDKAELSPENQIPESMAPVVKQLRAAFSYKNYQLLSSMLLRSSEGAQAKNEGVMKSLSTIQNYSRPSGYTVAYREASVSSEGGMPAIHLGDFLFMTQVPIGEATNIQFVNVNIRTDVDLREGQKIVAGKANIGNNDLALFVVLTARLVD